MQQHKSVGFLLASARPCAATSCIQVQKYSLCWYKSTNTYTKSAWGRASRGGNEEKEGLSYNKVWAAAMEQGKGEVELMYISDRLHAADVSSNHSDVGGGSGSRYFCTSK